MANSQPDELRARGEAPAFPEGCRFGRPSLWHCFPEQLLGCDVDRLPEELAPQLASPVDQGSMSFGAEVVVDGQIHVVTVSASPCVTHPNTRTFLPPIERAAVSTRGRPAGKRGTRSVPRSAAQSSGSAQDGEFAEIAARYLISRLDRPGIDPRSAR